MMNPSPINADWTPTLDPRDLDHILAHTAGLWDEARGKGFFLTGGTGFFGHWLLESFLWVNDRLDLGARMTVLSRDPEKFAAEFPRLATHPVLAWVKGDVKSFAFPQGEYPFVVHAASEGDVKLGQEQPLRVFDTIVDGTRRVLEFARTHGGEKFLFTSSGAVYGKQPTELTHIPEDYTGAPDPLDPRSAYGEGKRAAETLCALYDRQYGLRPKIARCFAFIGPYLPLDANFAAGNFMRDALKGGPIVIQGDGTPYRSYLYAADLAVWLWTILFKGEPCRAYNVGSGQDLTILDLAQAVQRTNNNGSEIVVNEKHDPSKPVLRYVPDVNRAIDELKLFEWVTLEEGLVKTREWILQR